MRPSSNVRSASATRPASKRRRPFAASAARSPGFRESDRSYASSASGFRPARTSNAPFAFQVVRSIGSIRPAASNSSRAVSTFPTRSRATARSRLASTSRGSISSNRSPTSAASLKDPWDTRRSRLTRRRSARSGARPTAFAIAESASFPWPLPLAARAARPRLDVFRVGDGEPTARLERLLRAAEALQGGAQARQCDLVLRVRCDDRLVDRDGLLVPVQLQEARTLLQQRRRHRLVPKGRLAVRVRGLLVPLEPLERGAFPEP